MLHLVDSRTIDQMIGFARQRRIDSNDIRFLQQLLQRDLIDELISQPFLIGAAVAKNMHPQSVGLAGQLETASPESDDTDRFAADFQLPRCGTNQLPGCNPSNPYFSRYRCLFEHSYRYQTKVLA